jgi:hypothetical protein
MTKILVWLVKNKQMKQTFNCKVRKIWKTFILLLAIISLGDQSGIGQVAVAEKSILVEADEEGTLFYHWNNSCGIPYMRVAIWLSLQDSDLRKYNPIAEGQSFRMAKKIRMPVAKDRLVFSNGMRKDSIKPLQIWYKVKKGETLYRIARNYAGCSMAQLMQINQKVQWEIHEGEKIMLGTILPGDKTSKEESGSLPVSAGTKEKTLNLPLKEPAGQTEAPEVTNQDEMKRWVEEEVIGGKVKNDKNGKSFFVLHNTAQQGSTMVVYNPMLRRAISAKVLGPIPVGTYREEIQVILSAAAARELGIIDFRFKVRLRYELPAELE